MCAFLGPCALSVTCLHVHCPCRVRSIISAFYLHVFARPLLWAFHIQTLCANPLRVPVGPPLPSVHGCINITCNTNDVHKPRRPHTCMEHAHGRLITHTLSIYVMPSVNCGGYHCMCGNTLTIPHAPSLFFFIPTPSVYLAAQIGCSRCAHHLITLKFKQIIVFLQLTLGLRVCGTGVSVVRAASGVRAGVADGCVRHGAGRR